MLIHGHTRPQCYTNHIANNGPVVVKMEMMSWSPEARYTKLG